jgi:hypothetical protein
MKRLIFCLASVIGVTVLPLSAAVHGDYVEVRSADVYTGPCFANAQVNLTGDQAILAWHVRNGEYQGVGLDGMNVVAVVQASHTLGDPYADPLPAHAILILDQRATRAQQLALRSMAVSMAGGLLSDIVGVRTAPISLDSSQPGAVDLRAGDLARIRTRSLMACDMICGNEEVYYQPLVRLSHAEPAFTLVEAYAGGGLGATWHRVDTRSAFIGTFSR